MVPRVDTTGGDYKRLHKESLLRRLDDPVWKSLRRRRVALLSCVVDPEGDTPEAQELRELHARTEDHFTGFVRLEYVSLDN